MIDGPNLLNWISHRWPSTRGQPTVPLAVFQIYEDTFFINRRIYSKSSSLKGSFNRWFVHSVSGVGGEGASSKRWRVWGSETGWPTMSASMRSTLQTVPESVPADHVTNSKVSTKTWGTPSSLRSCNRNCSFSRTKRHAVSARSCERVLSAHHNVLENVRLLRSVGARSKTLRAAISYVRVPTIFSISPTEENVITAGRHGRRFVGR